MSEKAGPNVDGTLPALNLDDPAPGAAERTRTPPAMEIPRPTICAPTAMARVLLVHSDPDERRRLAALCSEAGGRADVVEVDNGQDAIPLVLEDTFDVVVTDTALIGMDGFTLLRVIRGRYSRVELPVFFASKDADMPTRVNGFRLGASDFICGSYSDDEFIARLQTQLNVTQMHKNALILMDELRILVDTDALTGLKNRRAFLRDLRAEFSRASRTRQACSLLLIDVDHFKRVNDSFGHPAGDDVLRAIAGLLRDGAREYDSVGRLGGEEFGVLLPEVDAVGATVVAERIRSSISARPLGPPGVGQVTVSVGLALGPKSALDNEDALLRRADDALYAAKNDGRDRIFVDDGRDQSWCFRAT